MNWLIEKGIALSFIGPVVDELELLPTVGILDAVFNFFIGGWLVFGLTPSISASDLCLFCDEATGVAVVDATAVAVLLVDDALAWLEDGVSGSSAVGVGLTHSRSSKNTISLSGAIFGTENAWKVSGRSGGANLELIRPDASCWWIRGEVSHDA